jgi:starvation-inducible DNA-binding protein
MGIILTNDNAAFAPMRIKSPKMKPDEVEESKGKVKKLPADNTGATMTMAKNMFVQGGAEVRPNGMVKQDDAGEMCAECLKGCIGDMLAFYMKAQAYHWNVMGQDFAQFHELFGEIYEGVHGSIDKFAEFLRAMGYMAPFTMEAFINTTGVQRGPVEPTPAGMANDLYLANVYMQDKLMSLYHKAEAAMNHGLSNFVQDRMAAHQKYGWQLGASLGMPEFAKATE